MDDLYIILFQKINSSSSRQQVLQNIPREQVKLAPPHTHTHTQYIHRETRTQTHNA